MKWTIQTFLFPFTFYLFWLFFWVLCRWNAVDFGVSWQCDLSWIVYLSWVGGSNKCTACLLISCLWKNTNIIDPIRLAQSITNSLYFQSYVDISVSNTSRSHSTSNRISHNCYYSPVPYKERFMFTYTYLFNAEYVVETEPSKFKWTIKRAPVFNLISTCIVHTWTVSRRAYFHIWHWLIVGLFKLGTHSKSTPINLIHKHCLFSHQVYVCFFRSFFVRRVPNEWHHIYNIREKKKQKW